MTINDDLLDTGWQYHNLLMSPLSSHDWPLFAALYCDAKIMRHICPPFIAEDALIFFKKTITTQYVRPISKRWYTIRGCEDSVPFGLCGIANIDYLEERAEVGIMLLSAAQCKNVAVDALGSLVNKMLLSLPINKIFCRVHSENFAAQRLVKKLGFKLVPMGADGLQRWELDIKKTHNL